MYKACCSNAMQQIKDVPVWIWLWLVPAPYIVQIVFLYLDSQNRYFDTVFTGEAGVIENGTALFLFLAVIIAITCVRLAQRRNLSVVAVLLTIFAIGCFLLFGEELSWGQHIFDWQSPEYFNEYNKKKETNLHNMGYVNRSVPKWIVVISMAVGGALLPLIFRQLKAVYSPRVHWIFWLLPTRICGPAGVIVLVSHISSKIHSLDEYAVAVGISLRESTELYISIFFLIYIFSLQTRMKSASSRGDQAISIGP